MGRVLVIKGADFANVAVGNVTPLMSYVVGKVIDEDGTIIDAKNRGYCETYIDTSVFSKVSFNSSVYKIMYACYDANKVFIERKPYRTWYTSEMYFAEECPTAKYVRVNIGRVDDENITPSEIESAISLVPITPD